MGVSRYSLEESETDNEHKDFTKLFAHFILTAAVSVVGGVLTKYWVSPHAEAMIAGGIVVALIGYARVRALAYTILVKRLRLNGHGKKNGEDS